MVLIDTFTIQDINMDSNRLSSDLSSKEFKA